MKDLQFEFEGSPIKQGLKLMCVIFWMKIPILGADTTVSKPFTG